MIRKILLFTVIISLFSSSLAGQGNKPVRLEIPVKDDTEVYRVVPAGEFGVMIIYLSSETDENQQMLWVTAMLDRNLKEIWRQSIPLPKGFILEESLYSNTHVISFFHNPKSSDEHNFRIIDSDVSAGTYAQTSYSVPEKSGAAYFSVGDQVAVAGINIRKDESILLAYRFDRKIILEINPGTAGQAVIESISIDKSSGTISAILRTLGSAKKRAYFLVKANSEGIVLSNLQLSKFDDNRMINTAFAHKIDGLNDIIIGSYGRSSRTRTIEGRESIGVASTGFFSILIRNNAEVTTNFYEFTDFRDFYRYLRRPSDLNVRRGSIRDRNRDYSIDHDLLAHEVFVWNDQLIFMAEAYYPEYRTITTMVYDYYGRPYPTTYSVFEGFRYLTTFVAGFDREGTLLWNNDLELRDMLTQTLKRRVVSWEDPEGLVLAYANNGKIFSKLIHKDQTIESISSADIATLNARDRIFEDSHSIIERWYDSYFLIHGYQNIKNSYVNSRNNKTVFYINKIAYF